MGNLLSSPMLLRVVAAVAALFITRFLYNWWFYRRLIHRLPGPPHSWLWGSLASLEAARAKGPRHGHSHNTILALKREFNLGDYYYVDVWPFGDPILVVGDPDLASQFMAQPSLPKHQKVSDFLAPFGGRQNIASLEGPEWKKWRSIFNPGFSNSALMGLVPDIVDECNVFKRLLEQSAATQELFHMQDMATKLAVDVIGRAVLGTSFKSQTQSNELVDAFLSQTVNTTAGLTAQKFSWLKLIDPRPYLTQRRNFRTIVRIFGELLDQRFQETKHQRSKRSKTIIDLALETFYESRPDAATRKTLDPEFRSFATSNLGTFIFAGHDTTSSSLAYTYYYLSRYPGVLQKMQSEHDQVLSSDAANAASTIKNSPHLVSRLTYTLAVIRETMRLQPPADMVRMGQKGFFLHDPKSGESLPTEHCMLYLNAPNVHRNSKHWQDPDTFWPERHLSSSEDGSANFTSNPAWVTFSKGPRNCIGQELAMIEIKIVLALTVRTLRMVPAFDRLQSMKSSEIYPMDTEDTQEMFGEEAYQIQIGAGKPRAGMPCYMETIDRLQEA